MKKNRKIKKELKTVILNLFPGTKSVTTTNSHGVERKIRPIIYIQYYGKIVQYVGQSIDLYTGRPFRACNSSYENKYPVTYVRWIDASQDDQRRVFWEAVVVCQLRPKQQNYKTYKRRVAIYHEDKLRRERRERYMKPLKEFMKAV